MAKFTLRHYCCGEKIFYRTYPFKSRTKCHVSHGCQNPARQEKAKFPPWCVTRTVVASAHASLEESARPEFWLTKPTNRCRALSSRECAASWSPISSSCTHCCRSSSIVSGTVAHVEVTQSGGPRARTYTAPQRSVLVERAGETVHVLRDSIECALNLVKGLRRLGHVLIEPLERGPQ
eukprot:7391678-Prymnesium_polylepis.2